jgi:hypothetical protein
MHWFKVQPTCACAVKLPANARRVNRIVFIREKRATQRVKNDSLSLDVRRISSRSSCSFQELDLLRIRMRPAQNPMTAIALQPPHAFPCPGGVDAHQIFACDDVISAEAHRGFIFPALGRLSFWRQPRHRDEVRPQDLKA